jgi:hypothetical protein
MTPESSTLGNVDVTTALLQAELPRLEEHQQELEKKLATVTERVESVRTAPSALQALSAAPPVSLAAVTTSDSAAPLIPAARTEAVTVTEPEAAPQAQDAGAATAPAAAGVGTKTPKAAKAPAKKQKKAVPAQKSAAAKPAAVKSAAKPAVAKPAAAKPGKSKAESKPAPAAPADDTGNLTAQVIEIVAASGSTPLRARDVTEALGRELTTSSINTVRSTLDRLVATSRAGRAGRGLYRAPAN